MGDIQQELTTSLLSIYPEGEANSICDWVMEYYTGKSRMQRLMDQSTELSKVIINAIHLAKEELLQHRPVQYVLGEAWFMGLKFLVNESVLIPRPETEELVAFAIANRQHATVSILDIGTGSGCIPIALKKQLPDAQITSIDVINEALQVAVKNATANGTNIHFIHLDFLDENKWPALPIFDIIISNPPYVPLAEKALLDKHVTAWEPGTALFVPDGDALIFYKKIAVFGKKHLQSSGKIFVETHQDYAMVTQQIFESNGYQTELQKDINKNDRMVMAWGGMEFL